MKVNTRKKCYNCKKPQRNRVVKKKPKKMVKSMRRLSLTKKSRKPKKSPRLIKKSKVLKKTVRYNKSMHKEIKVVKITDNGPQRTILKKGEYKYDSGKITLPKGFYSAGYYERLTDGDWNKLPELIEKDSSKIK